MVPSSAAKALPTRPATMMEVTTGVSSRASASASTPPTDRVSPSFANSLAGGAQSGRKGAGGVSSSGSRTRGSSVRRDVAGEKRIPTLEEAAAAAAVCVGPPIPPRRSLTG